MRIALCSYSQKEKETALLMKLGKVDRFDNGVFCTYAMQRDGPYDAVVVMEDGAKDLMFCTGSKLLEDFKGRKLIAFGGEWSVGFLTKHNPGLVLDDWLTVSK